jgi:acyl-[acyl carrier protein]--UDP-N-acetylglucosamine O-acyltransferase
LFQADGNFAERLDNVAKEFAAVPLVMQIVDFLRNAGKRPVMMARARGKIEEDPLEGQI